MMQISESFRIDEGRTLHYLQRLIEIPSLPGEEKAVADFIDLHLRGMGLQVDVFEPELGSLQQSGASSPLVTSVNYTGRPNVVGVWKGIGNGRSLLFNCHTDVVPTGPIGAWRTPPWKASTRDGRVYGRGALDMKGGIAAVLSALAAIREADIQLRGDVILECVVDEEAGGNGTLAAILRGYRADAAVFAEPSGADLLYTGHRGGLRFQITVFGEPAQLFRRDTGVNAIEKMQPVIAALDQFREQRLKTIKHPSFSKIPNPVPLYVGEIHGGSWFSSIALECRIDGICGWLPGETLDSVKNSFEQFLCDAFSSDPWLRDNPPEVTFPSNWVQPCSTDPAADIVQTAISTATRVLGTKPVTAIANSGADMSLRCGHSHMPCIWYGPTGGNAHGPDEYVEFQSVVDMAKIYAALIVDWCNRERL